MNETQFNWVIDCPGLGFFQRSLGHYYQAATFSSKQILWGSTTIIQMEILKYLNFYINSFHYVEPQNDDQTTLQPIYLHRSTNLPF